MLWWVLAWLVLVLVGLGLWAWLGLRLYRRTRALLGELSATMQDLETNLERSAARSYTADSHPV